MECECGNKDKSRFCVATEIVDFKVVRCGKVVDRRPVFQPKGWRCQDCQKLIKD